MHCYYQHEGCSHEDDADDLAVIVESKQELLWVGHKREELNTRLGGKEIKQMGGFVYLGGMVTEDGHS